MSKLIVELRKVMKCNVYIFSVLLLCGFSCASVEEDDSRVDHMSSSSGLKNKNGKTVLSELEKFNKEGKDRSKLTLKEREDKKVKSPSRETVEYNFYTISNDSQGCSNSGLWDDALDEDVKIVGTSCNHGKTDSIQENGAVKKYFDSNK